MGLRYVAVPIFNHQGYPIAVIRVSKYLNTLSSDLQDKIAQDIVGMVRQISYRLGYSVAS